MRDINFLIPKDEEAQRKMRCVRIDLVARSHRLELDLDLNNGSTQLVVAGVRLAPSRLKVFKFFDYVFVFCWLTPAEIEELGNRGVPVLEFFPPHPLEF